MAAVESAAPTAGAGGPVDPSKPKVLILGGNGFIGRNFVKYLVDSNLCSLIRVADKKPPATAFFSEDFKATFASPIVEFRQANLTSDASIAKAFALETAEDKFTYVFNLAAETQFGQNDQVYENGILTLVKKCAAAAHAQGCERFVEVSSAQVYKPNSKPSNEKGEIKPWTMQAKWKLQAEGALKEITGLQWNVLRPAIVYGPGDVTGIMPRVMCGAVYKHLNEKYKVLWSGDLKQNTVHVHDVVRAMWHVATSSPSEQIFNLADKGNTDQGKINAILETLFGIKTGFIGTLMSNLAKMDMASAKSYANDKHMEPWGAMCSAAGIGNTPLTPYISEELLKDDHMCIDGSAIEATGFTYEIPQMTDAQVRAAVQEYIKMDLFPPGLL